QRKFEDALHVLDDATRPASPTESTQPPSKRLRPSGPSRSLYATLAKYGIKKEAKTPVQENRLQSLSKNAPHLVALLTRTATRARRANPFKSSPPPTTPLKSGNVASEYRPSSTSSFLQRLATYKLTTYANKPSAIDAVAAAKCGWVNDGKDRLVCGICNISWVVASTSGLNRDAANALVEKQRVQLVDMHKDGCPWKTGQCDASIYRVPLQTPLATARELKTNAIKLNSAMKDVQIKHPLTAAQTQALENIIKSVKLLDTSSTPSSSAEVDPPESISMAGPSSFSSSAPLLLGEPSTTAIITALFGWSIVPPPPAQQTRPTSISRASSLAPSSPQLSATPRRISRNSTPTPASASAPVHSGMHISRMSSLSRQVSSTSVVPPSATNSTLLHCVLCQRRVGLWAFLPPAPLSSSASANGEGGSEKEVQRRQFDVLKEHRSYCPYVVRSTNVPSLPIPPQQLSSSSTSLLGTPGELEGWRAVLSVVLRYGATHGQRLGLGLNYSGRSSVDSVRGNGGEGASVGGEGEGEREVDAVAAMVEGVKTRGGRDLLKYVKGLLG
ncbi:C3HC zinc finger-like-domain-containing protein, partial [Irpex lacteus]